MNLCKGVCPEEYIPANLSLYKFERSLAINGITDEQFPIPNNNMDVNIDPAMLNKSCSPFLENKYHISTSYIEMK